MLCRVLARHGRHAILKAVARKCRRILDCLENADDYDFETNGERRVLELLVRSGATCLFDVGANVGDWALLAQRLGPDASVHCFEIVPETCARLADRTRSFPRLVVNPFGLADRAGEVPVRYFPGLSVLATLTGFPHALDSVSVPGRVMRGDDYLAQHRIERVDFLKIDVEGAEEQVLRGFDGALSARRVQVVQFEYGKASIVTKFLLRDFYAFFSGAELRSRQDLPPQRRLPTLRVRARGLPRLELRGGGTRPARADRRPGRHGAEARGPGSGTGRSRTLARRRSRASGERP